MESMAGIDAKFLYSETPTAHMHTIKVAISDVSGVPGGFTYDGLVDVLGEHIGRLPTFRRRIVAVPLGLGHPVWVEDPDFDLARHLSQRLLPLPGGPRQLGAVIAEFASRPLRRDRPLWEIVVVEGLAGGRIAIVAKLHHALADGSASVALLKNIVEAIGEPPGAPPGDGWHPEALPPRGQLLRIAGRDHLARLRGLPRLAVQSIRGMRDSEVLRRHLAVKPPLPLLAPRTPLNVSLGLARTFAMTTLPLDDLKAVRRAQGTTLNDVYLTVCAGALRGYLREHGGLPRRPLVASVPISTDPSTTRLSGNRVDSLYVTIGTDIADPIDRLRHIHAVATGAKEVRRVLGYKMLEQRAAIVPPQLYQAAVRLWSRSRLANRVPPPLNVVLSCVAGPKERIRIGPVVLEELYSVGPILEGIGLNMTAWSYEDDLTVSVLGCPESVPDPWEITELLRGALDELRAACGDIATAETVTDDRHPT